KVGKGDGDLPSIPNVTANTVPDDYKITLPELLAKAHAEADLPEPEPVVESAKKATPAPVVVGEESAFSGVSIIGLLLGIGVAPMLARKFKGMSAGEIVSYILELSQSTLKSIFEIAQNLLQKFKK
ncbi:MAG: copper oxidase, partial [Methylococcales bacterium]|nr:copper oxidase [Methylococcales bacterium]